jgi:ribonuclease HI
MKRMIIYTDGGARGNPGPAGAGVVFYNEQGKIVKKISKYIGKATNNQAEYKALILGLKEAINLKPFLVDFFLDSELLVRQIQGQYRVKNNKLKVLHQEAKELINKFEKINFNHTVREDNILADKLVNKAIDDYLD